MGLLKFDSPSLVTHASIQIYSLTNVVSTLWNRPIAPAIIICMLSCSEFCLRIVSHTYTHFFAIFSGLAETSDPEIYYQHRLSTNIDSGLLPLMRLLLKDSRVFEMEITIKGMLQKF